MQFLRKFFSPVLKLLPLVFLVSIFFITTSQAQELPTFIFLRDLREGDSGQDVLELQKVLNQDVATRIAPVGAGSPGQETNYFDQMTKDGVIRFQNKYASEVLHPVGMTEGSGFVGLWTRLKLNQIILKSSVAVKQTTTVDSSAQNVSSSAAQTSSRRSLTQTQTSNSSNQSPVNLDGVQALLASNEFMVSQASVNSGPVGTRVTIAGAGFSLQSNTVNFGREKISVAAQNTREIAFTVPNVAAGRYDVSITTGGKTSDPIPFMVTIAGAKIPIIEKIEPATATFGKEIKITGQNFTRTGNIVTSSLGVIKDLKSADGKNITFTVPLPEYLKLDIPEVRRAWFGKRDNLYWEVHLRIVNENGISEATPASQFIINI